MEALPGPTEHPASHELFDARGSGLVVEVCGALQERELELLPDDRGHPGELTRPLTQSLQPTSDELADAQRNAETGKTGLKAASIRAVPGDEPAINNTFGHVATCKWKFVRTSSTNPNVSACPF
jgi:hypothetical protein